ncbi:GNAT family N-acetyltransferase [Paenibacillus wulumuqiensis]|uniref:GNAT family N-acetyltransferase n=1 Tax=Paenibacillus wulumuqiensis TaxID=1567107 RepID=UPI000619B241|nr:GNAT family N-acetyltransferase [Paenibacillus wulumuqiensis]
MKLSRIEELSIEDWRQLGNFGYISTHKYELVKEETQNFFSMRLNLTQLDSPYVKEEMNNEDDLKQYNEIIKQGYSFGLYSEGSIIAAAIVEPQNWNNTLMIWHLQVNEKHTRKGYGRLLLNRVNDMAREKGFRAVTVETQNTNVPAIHFYMNCDYRIEGIDVSLYSNNDTTNEEIALYMRKKIE